MMKQKKAQAIVNVFIAFFVAFIAIILIYAFASVSLTFTHGVANKGTIDLTVSQISKSNVCNYDLINFLRMEDNFGFTYAERLALNKDFDKKATEFFNKNYIRGDITRQKWKMEIFTTDFKPISSLGNATDIRVNDTCKQIIPRNNGDIVIVRLGVEY